MCFYKIKLTKVLKSETNHQSVFYLSETLLRGHKTSLDELGGTISLRSKFLLSADSRKRKHK